MTDINEADIENRRAMWANAARADLNMSVERRCYNVFHAADLSDGTITSCYIGLGYLLIPDNQDNFKPRWLSGVNHLTGQLMSDDQEEVRDAIYDYYGVDPNDIEDLISMSDGGSLVEEMNGSMLNKEYPRLYAQEDTSE